MARARAERTKSKASLIEDLTQGVDRLQEFISQIEDLGREGFPYLEGARARTELQLRECIRKVFGEKSPEYQHYLQHKLSMESPADTKKSVAYIKALIASLEDKKLELQGLKPLPPAEPPAPPPVPTPRPRMTLVPPPTAPITPVVPTAQVTITSVAPVQPPPVTMSVALSTNLDMAKAPTPVAPFPAPAAPAAIVQPETPKPPVALSTTSTVAAVPVSSLAPPTTMASAPASSAPPAPPVAPRQTAPQSVNPPTAVPDPVMTKPDAPPAQEAPPVQEQSAQVVKSEPAPPVATKSEPAAERAARADSATKPAPSAAAEPSAAVSVPGDPAEAVKSICRRFHLVARQLRLRGEYRATLDVEDEFDVQDLLHALLRLHFDDIETDEWVPSYSGGSPRIMFLLNDGRLAVVVKKTRTGLTAKDLGEQLRVDADHCRTLKRCSTLLCFVYDPEGRIGNPRGLEADLISISDQLTADVFVAPK